ncbi:mannose receptor [Plakobranchus ocellatus]|uniref:Mannose receptor n=1 Tax=Plakobranchus ocellatus TaxID=259542 RepID=A0AAV4AI89_9GAST|nr:mannose receptor [Plakobranchus ocellatus]
MHSTPAANAKNTSVSGLIRNKMAQTLSQFLIVVAFLTVAGAESKCPVGWSYFGGSCYYLGSAGANFSTAKSACTDVDSELVSISSPEENTFVKSLLKDNEAAGAWFGLVFTQDGLNFEWDNVDRSIPISFTDWADSNIEININLPDDQDRYKKIQCASFSKQHDWAWESKPCDESADMKYVCKRCASEQVCTSRTCFRLLCEKTVHFVAKRHCKDVGGSLATIRSEGESKAIKNLLDQVSFSHDEWGQGGSDVWLAGSDEDSEGIWYWDINGQQETISADGFTDWRTGEPNDAGSGENCMAMSAGDWKWNDIRCRSLKFILCEIPDLNAITG